MPQILTDNIYYLYMQSIFESFNARGNKQDQKVDHDD
jgi:hypothetical protein